MFLHRPCAKANLPSHSIMSCCEEAKSALKAVFDQFCIDFDEQRFDKVIEYYHPDAVLIETGKKCVYGKESIKHEILEFSKLMGKMQMKVTEEHYQKSPDFIIVNGSYETTTEKTGEVKGTFLQIWRKTGDKYLLLRDEYTVT